MTTSVTKSKKSSLVPKSIEKQIYLSWVVALLIVLISVIYYFISQPQLPIFYSLATKSDQLATKEFIFLFPIISVLMNLSHLFVIKVLKNYSALMLKLFVITFLRAREGGAILYIPPDPNLSCR